MDATTEHEPIPAESSTGVERTSERELVVSRTIDAPARLVFDAWTRADLFQRWWVPKSFPISLLSCELDARVGGRYRLVFGDRESTMEFFGTYLEVTPHSRLAWTNDEEDAGPVTTVKFEETGDRTLVVVQDLYPSKEALDAAIAAGSTGIDTMPESLEQLDELLATPGASVGPTSDDARG
jgi:uncharacterized protein YndB with AHSA1/START domain